MEVWRFKCKVAESRQGSVPTNVAYCHLILDCVPVLLFVNGPVGVLDPCHRSQPVFYSETWLYRLGLHCVCFSVEFSHFQYEGAHTSSRKYWDWVLYVYQCQTEEKIMHLNYFFLLYVDEIKVRFKCRTVAWSQTLTMVSACVRCGFRWNLFGLIYSKVLFPCHQEVTDC